MQRLPFLALLAVLALGSPAPSRSTEPKPLPSFALTDHHGQPFSLATMRGRWTVLALGYTSCPDICPFTLMNLEDVLTALSTRMAPERLPRIVFLAVDPARDRPVLAAFMRSFHPAFLGVSGPENEVASLVGALDGVARHEPANASGNYAVVHSAFLSVVDPTGRVVAKLYPPLEAGPTADALARLLRAAPAS
jgi:protein SCO1/2